MSPTNEQIAACLDPQRKRDGWWMVTRIPVGNKPMQTKYTGPDFYAAGVCAEEVEPVVWEAGCTVTRWRGNETNIFKPEHETDEIRAWVTHTHHPTACILALAKIKEGA